MMKATGPAPNAYHLPNVTGYVKHDPTKTRLPAFTMGQRLPPGPMMASLNKVPVTQYQYDYCGERNCVRCSFEEEKKIACCSQKAVGGAPKKVGAGPSVKKKMPTYKLTYFPVQALAEPIRFLLSYQGQDFEDFRFEREDWPSIKPNMPFGKVPVLEIDGKKIHQSTAICRYLGKEAGLAGSNNWEDLQIDIAVDTLHDFRQAVGGYWYETDPAAKEKKKATVLSEVAPEFLKKFDQLVKDNGGYLANGKLSWGDLYFIGVSDYINAMLGFSMFEKHENLRQLKERVTALPKIQEWLAKRPKTDL